MEDKELISQLTQLKQIAPRKEWVSLVRSQIISNPQKGYHYDSRHNVFSVMDFLYKRNFAYAFAALLVTVLGTFGLSQYVLTQDGTYPSDSVAPKLQASLIGTSEVKSNVENLKRKSQDLAVATKDGKSGSIASAISEVKDATKNLTTAIQKDPAIAKEVALEIKHSGALLDITAGPDLKETSDNLYKIIDAQMIQDLQKTTLTEDQKVVLNQVTQLYHDGNYIEALEHILLISN